MKMGGSAAINYLHEGSPKIWIIIKPSSTKKFVKIIRKIYSKFDASFSTCENPLKHKTYMTDLAFLDEHNIEYDVVTQEAGTYMILWPNVYHSGYNMGLNISEAKNFLTPDWAQAHKSIKSCTCSMKKVNCPID